MTTKSLLLPSEFFQKQEEEEEEAQPLTHQATMEEFMASVLPRLLSFLQKDDSFLCPWNWRPNASQNQASSSAKTTMQQYMQFQPGSFLAGPVI